MSEINLKQITKELADADENYATSMRKLYPLEYQYQLRLDQLQLQSGRANQYLREAEARNIIMKEDIYVDYQNAKLEAKLAYIRLQTLMEVSKNMRNLAYEQ